MDGTIAQANDAIQTNTIRTDRAWVRAYGSLLIVPSNGDIIDANDRRCWSEKTSVLRVRHSLSERFSFGHHSLHI